MQGAPGFYLVKKLVGSKEVLANELASVTKTRSHNTRKIEKKHLT
jgi:hypothetical protein